jgi:hypothetical protein
MAEYVDLSIYELHIGELIDERGDVNLNGINYEIADWVVFSNYFLMGLPAFTISTTRQINATEINGDGIPLTVHDFVYLRGVIIGEFLPLPGVKDPFDTITGTLVFTNTDTSIIVSSNFEDSIGVIHICLYAPDLQNIDYYDIRVNPEIDSNNVAYNAHDDSVKILVMKSAWASTLNGVVGSEQIDIMEIPYSGEIPIIAYASAAGKKSEYVDLIITGNMDNPPEFDTYPTQLDNADNGSFSNQFMAADDDMFADLIEYHILSGPGEINTQTGEWMYNPYCEEIGTLYNLEICASDPTHSCPQSNTELHALVELNITIEPPQLGDVNADNLINLLDITYLINYIYKGGPVPEPEYAAGNVNGIEGLNLLDITYLIAFIYRDGPPPVCPG